MDGGWNPGTIFSLLSWIIRVFSLADGDVCFWKRYGGGFLEAAASSVSMIPPLPLASMGRLAGLLFLFEHYSTMSLVLFGFYVGQTS